MRVSMSDAYMRPTAEGGVGDVEDLENAVNPEGETRKPKQRKRKSI